MVACEPRAGIEANCVALLHFAGGHRALLQFTRFLDGLSADFGLNSPIPSLALGFV
jgi:hypothetical protein